MAGYSAWLQKGLARYSVAAPPFEFLADFARQDKLLEWIEFAAYICSTIERRSGD